MRVERLSKPGYRPVPLPYSVTAAACTLAASSGILVINVIPLFFAPELLDLPTAWAIVAVVIVAIVALGMAAVPALSALFALRGRRWPLIVSTVFALLMITSVIGFADAPTPLYVAATVAAALGSALLWLRSARAYQRATRRSSQRGV